MFEICSLVSWATVDLQSPLLVPGQCSVAQGEACMVLEKRTARAPEIAPANNSLSSLVFKGHLTIPNLMRESLSRAGTKKSSNSAPEIYRSWELSPREDS